MYAACVHMHTGCISKCLRIKLWHTGWHPCTFIPTPCLRHCSRLHIKEFRSLYEKQHRPVWSHSTGKCGVNGKCFFLASHGTCNFSHCTERCSKGNTHVRKNREMQEPWLQSQVLWEQRQQRQRNIHRPISPLGWTQVLSIQIGWSRRMAWKVHSEMINVQVVPFSSRRCCALKGVESCARGIVARRALSKSMAAAGLSTVRHWQITGITWQASTTGLCNIFSCFELDHSCSGM